MKLLIASRNAHKISEIREILDLPELKIVGAGEIPGLPEVIEDGRTFYDNAVKKAVTLALAAKMWTLADDSGLEVEALNGAPGIHSARYAGETVDYAANNARLLRELEGQTNRAARFGCVLALASPSGRVQVVEGYCPGSIIFEPRGALGFGYDPLFVPEGERLTFAEMDPAAKNRISHRSRALRKAREKWGEVLFLVLDDWPPRAGTIGRAAR